MQRKVCEMYQIYVARLNYIVCSVLHLAARLHPWQVRSLFTESILILGPKHIFFHQTQVYLGSDLWVRISVCNKLTLLRLN